MKPVVSIIVPVYNAEKTISRCIESILQQEYDDFELLLIDDGSKDNSGAICDDYAKKDARIRVVHKENSGVSSSRNLALDMAMGKYLQFLDADDWITPNATRTFIEAAEGSNADLVISDFYRVVEKRVSQKGSIDEEGLLSREEFASQMMENPADFYYGVLWNKFYRRDIISNHNLRMDENISWCEDFMFNLEYIRHAQNFYVVRLPLYYYVRTKGSLASQGMSISKTVKMKLMVFEYYNSFYKDVLSDEEYEQKRLQVYRFLIDSADDGIVLPSLLPNTKKLGEERSQVDKKLIQDDGILMDFYRSRKLLDYYLEPIAIRNELDLNDVKVLWGLKYCNVASTYAALADSVGMSRSIHYPILQKLVQKKLIKIEAERNPKQITISFSTDSDSILKDLELAEQNYEQLQFADFTEEEIVQYKKLTKKMKYNMTKIF